MAMTDETPLSSARLMPQFLERRLPDDVIAELCPKNAGNEFMGIKIVEMDRDSLLAVIAYMAENAELIAQAKKHRDRGLTGRTSAP